MNERSMFVFAVLAVVVALAAKEAGGALSDFNIQLWLTILYIDCYLSRQQETFDSKYKSPISKN